MTYRGHIKNGVAVLDAAALPDGTPVRVEVDRLHGEFWTNKSVQDLAADQQVKPIQDADGLVGDWPPEDSIDEFLEFLREARR